MSATRLLPIRALLLRLLPTLLAVNPSAAAWPNGPKANVPLCTELSSQVYPVIASDGSGGAIVAWKDFRSITSNDIFAQKVLASGEVDAAWPFNGAAICTAATDEWFPAIVSDGAGGAIVIWQVYDGGSFTDNVFAQRILSSGALDPAWPPGGLAVCTAPGTQIFGPLPPRVGDGYTVISDNRGGAIVVWQDLRRGSDYDIYAQHVLGSGVVDAAWPVDGRAICTAAGDQGSPTIASDWAGGAIIAWADSRGDDIDIYAQHVLMSGAVDPAWPVDGSALCTAVRHQERPMIASDGSGGAIVTWQDVLTSGLNNIYAIYAQHILASGAPDAVWPTNGRVLGGGVVGTQPNPRIISDGAGGAIVAWQDSRFGPPDIYAQRVLAPGTVDPSWPVDGRALTSTTDMDNQSFSTIVSDGAGGAVVVWRLASFAGGLGIYAQHVLSDGTLDGAWPADGRAVCSQPNPQGHPVAVSDGAGGVVVAWEDSRAGDGNRDIYAQGIGPILVGVPPGHIGALPGLVIEPNPFADGARISWSPVMVTGDARLMIHDVAGRLVFRSEVNGQAGSCVWDGHDRNGMRLHSGFYVISLTRGDLILHTTALRLR